MIALRANVADVSLGWEALLAVGLVLLARLGGC